MRAFMDRDFLLENETARTLFHKYAENQPIYDYHNHLPPREIAERKQYENLTQLWLAADHYKWRAMRACGVDEQYITGDAPEYEKFQKWAEVVPQLVGCPLYHWAHLELQRYFEISAPLTPETAPAIWEETKEKLKAYDAVSLLEKMNVRVLCTTDDPADTLEWHKKIAADPTIPFRVLPSFRPDNYLGGNPDAECALCEKYGTDSLPEALGKALDYFCENGCKVSDHGFSRFAYIPGTKQAELLHVLGKAYHAHGVMLIIVIYKRAVFAYNGLHGPLAQHHIAPACGPARYGDKLKPVFLQLPHGGIGFACQLAAVCYGIVHVEQYIFQLIQLTRLFFAKSLHVCPSFAQQKRP